MVWTVTLPADREEQCQQAFEDLSNLRHALDESTIVAITDSHGIITGVNGDL
jgi:hypothetical protein